MVPTHGTLTRAEVVSSHEAVVCKFPRLHPLVRLPVIPRRGVPALTLVPVRRLRGKSGDDHPITNRVRSHPTAHWKHVLTRLTTSS
jgi:hypothetical protein